jgi:hypothetical protein
VVQLLPAHQRSEMSLWPGAPARPPPLSQPEASALIERWASDSLCGLALGSVLPLLVSAIREWRESEGSRGAMQALWSHRLLDVCWSVGLGLDAASTHGKLLLWADGDTFLIAAAQALGWTAAAAARVLGPLPGWSAFTERRPRTVWALGRLGMALDHLASLRCQTLVGWARLHAACWCFAPLRSSFTAQGICWRGSAAGSAGPARAAKWKTASGNWAGAAGFGAAWYGARMVRAGQGDLAHTVSIALCAAQALLVFTTPRLRPTRQRRGGGSAGSGAGSSSRARAASPSSPLQQLARVICEGGSAGRQIVVATACSVASDAARVCADAFCLGPLAWLVLRCRSKTPALASHVSSSPSRSLTSILSV